jgi:TPR repeat protein
MYYEGLGVTLNYKNAVKWFKKSAQQGNQESQRYLHTLCFERPSACR